MHVHAATLVALAKFASALYLPTWLESSDHVRKLAGAVYHHVVPIETPSAFVMQQDTLNVMSKSTKVNVTLGVMSRCDDAVFCEGIWDKVLDRVGDLVNFELTYIGKINASDEQWGVTCKHGPLECLGNVHQLCLRDVAPEASVWFDLFVDCVNYSNQGDEPAARECAKLSGIDWDDMVAPCVTGKRGRQLLRDSVLKSQDLGISTSCSILYNQRLICVRDDGSWDCDRHDVADFAARVRKEYDRLN